MSDEKKAEEHVFSLRPDHKKKFRPQQVKDLIKATLAEKLEGQEYQADNVNNITKDVADVIRNRLKDLDYDRYKFIVQVVIGEQRGEGMKMGCRAFWDTDTDAFAEDIYMSWVSKFPARLFDHFSLCSTGLSIQFVAVLFIVTSQKQLFAVATVFGIYHY